MLDKVVKFVIALNVTMPSFLTRSARMQSELLPPSHSAQVDSFIVRPSFLVTMILTGNIGLNEVLPTWAAKSHFCVEAEAANWGSQKRALCPLLHFAQEGREFFSGHCLATWFKRPQRKHMPNSVPLSRLSDKLNC